ncbi:AAA family ATPase [Pseudomonas carnis]|uniref:AAA family ATPase n=1 Tax=Pseudomonas carnis TaxID=2487355 RepID=UPI00244BF6DC|nr:AAA family ATPase [Pseudomonas carnis]MDH0798008.1 ATP-binding protein [Pseudomonas carnis]
MTKIQAVRVEDRVIELLPQGIDRLGRLFEIDSVSLLLGTNGSGKTRMLLTLANAVGSSQDDSVQFYFQGTPNGNYEPQAPYNKDLCAIYYSALPYRRKLVRKPGVINASPSTKPYTDSRRVEQLGEVAEVLKVDTRLIGVFGYSRTVFRAVLIPALKSSREILSSELERAIFDLNGLVSTGNSAEIDDYKILDGKRESIFKRIEELLEQEADVRIGKTNRCLFLATLEYMYSKSKRYDESSAAIAFLSHVGLIFAPSDMSSFKKLQNIVEDTKVVLANYAYNEDFDWNKRVHKFQIDGIGQSEMVRRHETPIKIEWSNLSSGLQALVEQFSLIDEAIGKAAARRCFSILLLIDEGDAYLHLDWQRRYFSMLNKFLGGLKHKHNLKSLQLIMATHSPLLAADIPGELVTNLDSSSTINSFAAPLEEVIAGAFGSNSLGEFAASKINEIYKRAQAGKTTSEDRNIVEVIGDVAIKSALKRSIRR